MFPTNWSPWQIVRHAICEILTHHQIQRKELEKIMSALAELQSAVAQAQTDITTLATDVTAFIEANSGGATDAQLQALTPQVAQLSTLAKQIDALVNPPAAAPADQPSAS